MAAAAHVTQMPSSTAPRRVPSVSTSSYQDDVINPHHPPYVAHSRPRPSSRPSSRPTAFVFLHWPNGPLWASSSPTIVLLPLLAVACFALGYLLRRRRHACSPHWTSLAVADIPVLPEVHTSSPAAITKDDVSVRRYLTEFGVDMDNVNRRRPCVMNYAVSRVIEATVFLQRLGLDVKRVLNSCPQVVSCPVPHMQATADFLTALGVDVRKVVHRFPAVFVYSIDKLQATVDYLRGAGLDVVRVVHGLPEVFGLRLEKLQWTMAFLAGLGVDAVKVVNCRPVIFGLRQDNVERKMAYLEGMGMDVIKVVNALPSVFSCSIEGSLAPKLRYLTEEMGYRPADVNGFPPFLGASLEARIRPRHLFLKQRGRSRCSLSYMLAPTDAAFARRVAGCTLEEYVQWRSVQYEGETTHQSKPQPDALAPEQPGGHSPAPAPLPPP
eukprot:EG_transcript_11591